MNITLGTTDISPTSRSGVSLSEVYSIMQANPQFINSICCLRPSYHIAMILFGFPRTAKPPDWIMNFLKIIVFWMTGACSLRHTIVAVSNR